MRTGPSPSRLLLGFDDAFERKSVEPMAAISARHRLGHWADPARYGGIPMSCRPDAPGYRQPSAERFQS
jgi:hypothetical protein